MKSRKPISEKDSSRNYSRVIFSSSRDHYVRLREKASLFARIIFYHLSTLYLFTASDLKTTIIPSVAFALSISLGTSQSTLSEQLSRLPLTFFYAWFNTLAFAINNQCSNAAIEEDRLNKAWRPIPAGRISAENAVLLGQIVYPITIAASFFTGGWTASAMLWMLGYLYNDCAWGSRHWLVRNLLNGCGLVSFASGTLMVATGTPMNDDTREWICVVFAIVITTIHGQDIYDQAGDMLDGRSTVPLVFGDFIGRKSLVVFTLFWSIAAAVFWHTLSGAIVLTILGIWISSRWLMHREVQADRTTFKLYTVWLGLVYMLPMLANI